jgi:hypothetical protein
MAKTLGRNIKSRMQSIEYEGELTADDVVAGYYASLRIQRRDGLATVIQFLFWFVLLWAIGLAQGVQLLLLVTLAAVSLFRFYLNRRRIPSYLKRVHDQSAALRIRFRSRFDDHGFRTTSDLFDDRRPWSVLRFWAEEPDYFFLFEADDLSPRVIPKRVLGGEDAVQSLRDALTTNLGKPRSFS